MILALLPTASVRVQVTTYMPDSGRIPKLIELFDKSLKAVHRKWYQSNYIVINNLTPGTYTLRLSLSSGVQKDETFDIQSDEEKTIDIDISNNSPHESHEWAYFSKSFSSQAFRDTDMKSIDFFRERGKIVNGKLWKFTEGTWTEGIIPDFINQRIYGDGYVFGHDTATELSVLEISGEDIPNLYVSLPPANQLKILVKLADSSDEEVHPIDVTVSTDKLRAETLLTLLTNGAIGEAKTLTNAEEAEDYLYQKVLNPVLAAIGGYFLLKIGELERLHDWANNLANWFSWLPDGAIIHATQLLNKKEKTEADIALIKKRLLQAAGEGIPVYSEGLRLLEKGLKQLWYFSSSPDIKPVLDRIGNYLEVADRSQETTTFIGISPSKPGRARQDMSTRGPFEIIGNKKKNQGQQEDVFESMAV